jgi:hypothetical protein
MLTPDEFYDLQSILIQAMMPFIHLWAVFFLAAVILLAVFVLFLLVSREMMSRVQI